MKKLLILIPILFLFASLTEVNAQVVKYPFGSATEVSIDTITSDDTVATVTNRMTYAAAPIGGDVTVDMIPGNGLDLGAIVYLRIENKDGTDSAISWGSNITGTSDTITTAKSNLFELFYDGASFIVVGTRQID